MKQPTEQQAQQLFDTYNRRFFTGRLPAYRVLLSNRFSTGLRGMCWLERREIQVRTSCSLRKRSVPWE